MKQHTSIEEEKQKEIDEAQGGAGASSLNRMSGSRPNNRASSKVDAIKKSQEDQDKFVNKSVMDNND